MFDNHFLLLVVYDIVLLICYNYRSRVLTVLNILLFQANGMSNRHIIMFTPTTAKAQVLSRNNYVYYIYISMPSCPTIYRSILAQITCSAEPVCAIRRENAKLRNDNHLVNTSWNKYARFTSSKKTISKCIDS